MLLFANVFLNNSKISTMDTVYSSLTPRGDVIESCEPAPETCIKCLLFEETMRKLCLAVIEAKGGPTRY